MRVKSLQEFEDAPGDFVLDKPAGAAETGAQEPERPRQ